MHCAARDSTVSPLGQQDELLPWEVCVENWVLKGLHEERD